MLNFLNESKELDWSAFKAGSKGLIAREFPHSSLGTQGGIN